MLISDPINPENGKWETKKKPETKAVELNVENISTQSQTQSTQKQIQLKMLLEPNQTQSNIEPLFPEVSETENNNQGNESNNSFFSKNSLMKYPKRIISKFFNNNNLETEIPDNNSSSESGFNVSEKMKNPAAAPIANSVRNFINEFAQNKKLKPSLFPIYIRRFLQETQQLITNNPLWVFFLISSIIFFLFLIIFFFLF